MKLGYSKSKAMALTVAVLLSASVSGVALAKTPPVKVEHEGMHDEKRPEMVAEKHDEMRKDSRPERRERPTFESLDVDADGVISFDEFSLKAKGDKAEKFFSRMDKDGDGQVTEAEFNSPKPPRKGERMRDRMDKDKVEHKGGHEGHGDSGSVEK